jgi:oligopeptide/dipeptide ABC transporter ATP-binding protein
MVATNGAQTENLVEIKNLETYFEVGSKGIVMGIMANRKTVRAVDNVSLNIRQGETMGLVGESGCGKSTLGYNLVQLERPTAGSISFEGSDMADASRGDMQRIRRRLQIIFQDPQSALDARMTIGDAIAEPIKVHEIVPDDEIDNRVVDLLATVGLNPYMRNRYPHEFSGGQLQRIVIARALSLEPTFIVCDEPISALDVSIQAQIINLLEELQDRFGLTYLFISHDLRVVRHISDRVAVMYLGKVAEFSETDEMYDNPLHPYTRALLSAVPAGDPEEAKGKVRIALEGDVPSPIDPPSGCRFRTRCPIAIPSCADEVPPLREIASDHFVACQLA